MVYTIVLVVGSVFAEHKIEFKTTNRFPTFSYSKNGGTKSGRNFHRAAMCFKFKRILENIVLWLYEMHLSGTTDTAEAMAVDALT